MSLTDFLAKITTFFLDVTDNGGDTALDKANSKGQEEVVEYLKSRVHNQENFD